MVANSPLSNVAVNAGDVPAVVCVTPHIVAARSVALVWKISPDGLVTELLLFLNTPSRRSTAEPLVVVVTAAKGAELPPLPGLVRLTSSMGLVLSTPLNLTIAPDAGSLRLLVRRLHDVVLLLKFHV